ncbi:hypothetical protein BGX27_003604 [Mortierella sp. AM989]|nr:hypothetical protein BGX27_003604 [Mortierella sp. AM989]
MSSTAAAAGRAARKTRRNSIIDSKKTKRRSESPVAITTNAEDARNEVDHTKTIQQQRDEIEELTDTKIRLEDKVTQLEERAQYLEATSRLNASKVAAEIVDLKEKARKLEIELSTVIDERDILEQDIEELRTQTQDTEVKDEARHISQQLREAWLRIATMKSSQEDLVNKLYKAEETISKQQADLANAFDLSTAIKSELNDEKKLRDSEKLEYIAEINSFKEKLAESTKDGGNQLLDWEQDKTRLRNSFKHERVTWDKEKKGFMDQIASLKVKATALSVQKTAPPEWILEKHQLTEQCITLQSRITALESERTGSMGSSGPSTKRLEADKLKLEKKVEALKAKLVEVMEHAAKIQDEVKEKMIKQDTTNKKSTPNQRRRPRKRRDPESDEDELVVVVAAEDEGEIMQDIEPIKATPTVRETRAKRNAAVKNVNYQILSGSSDQSEESEEDDGEEDQSLEDDEDGDEDGDEGADEVEDDGDEVGPDKVKDTEMQELDNGTTLVEQNKTGSLSDPTESEEGLSSPQLEIPSTDNTDEKRDDMEQAPDDNAQTKSTTRSRKASASKPRRPTEDSSDSEFEPPMKTVIVKSRIRRNVKKSVSPSAEPVPKKAKITPTNKKRLNNTEYPESTDNQTTIKGKSIALNDTSHVPTDPTPDTQPSTVTPATTTTTSTSVTTSTLVNVETSTPIEKVKKKRKLLTGKGLEELGDILNGPGSSFSSAPSTGLVFGNSKTRLKGASKGLIGGTSANPANLEALNAIKMAFALPKPRNDSSVQDKEI